MASISTGAVSFEDGCGVGFGAINIASYTAHRLVAHTYSGEGRVSQGRGGVW